MKHKKQVNIEIDKLTNSIESALTGEVFQTEFTKVSSREIKKSDWLFNWQSELKNKENTIYKMTTVENKHIIQGLISLQKREDYIYVSLV